MVRVPIHIPPNVAAIGIYLFKYSLTLLSLYPKILISYSFNCFATSRGDDPDTSIHVFEKNAHVPKMNAEYRNVWIGSVTASVIDLGGLI